VTTSSAVFNWVLRNHDLVILGGTATQKDFHDVGLSEATGKRCFQSGDVLTEHSRPESCRIPRSRPQRLIAAFDSQTIRQFCVFSDQIQSKGGSHDAPPHFHDFVKLKRLLVKPFGLVPVLAGPLNFRPAQERVREFRSEMVGPHRSKLDCLLNKLLCLYSFFNMGGCPDKQRIHAEIPELTPVTIGQIAQFGQRSLQVRSSRENLDCAVFAQSTLPKNPNVWRFLAVVSNEAGSQGKKHKSQK
jgi:hypothetical protein